MSIRRALAHFAMCFVMTELSACASSGASGEATAANGATTQTGTARGRADQQFLTRQEIRASEYTSMYDVIFALRANWFRQRGADSFTSNAVLQVYLDNQRVGGVAELRGMAPMNILSARFFDPVAAAARWGADHRAGAIYVLTAK
jgi:hypothetical protein